MAESNSAGSEFKNLTPPHYHPSELTMKSILMGSILWNSIWCSFCIFLAFESRHLNSSCFNYQLPFSQFQSAEKILKTTILENNIIQTTGSAGESMAAGVVFTLPAFLFMSINDSGVSVGASYFNYWTILNLQCSEVYLEH